MSTEDEVRNASEQFYKALNHMFTGDAALLEEIWAHSFAVTTMHPMGGRQVGWDEVRESWREFARLASEGEVKLNNQVILFAEDMAYELGVELGEIKLVGQQVAIDHRVTNIYRLDAGKWKIVHHHTDVSPAMLDVLRGVNADILRFMSISGEKPKTH